MNISSILENTKIFVVTLCLVFGWGCIAMLFLPKVIALSVIGTILCAFLYFRINIKRHENLKYVGKRACLTSGLIAASTCFLLAMYSSNANIDYAALPDKSESIQSRAINILIAQAQQATKARLKDPDSAEFRNIYVSVSNGERIVCGEVNSKNSFGGYSGFQSFVGGASFILLKEDGKIFEDIWDEVCKRG